MEESDVKMEPLTEEQKEYVALKMVHHRIMTDWLEFQKSDDCPNCYPIISDKRLTMVNGKTWMLQQLVNEYMEMLKNPEIVELMIKMKE